MNGDIPTEEITSNVIVKDTANFGRTAFATRDLPRGTIVIAEMPMLRLRVNDRTDIHSSDEEVTNDIASPPSSDVRIDALRGAFRDLAAAACVSVEQLGTLFAIIANESTTGNLLDSVLADMFAPQTERSPAAEARCLDLLLSPAHFDKCVPNWCPAKQWFKKSTVLKISRLLACCRINVHADDTRGVAALFQKCSKFAHSCNANTFWFLHITGDVGAGQFMAVHVAVRDIAKDEALSFSYLGTGMNMLSSTCFRRAKLRDLSFDCVCDRCALFDTGRETCRSLQCAECDKMGAFSLVPTMGGWFCSRCRDVQDYSPGLSASLFRETVLRTAAMQLFFSSRGGSDYPSDDEVRRAQRSWIAPELAAAQFNGILVRWTLMELIERHLGPAHFLFMTGVFAVLRCWIKGVQVLVDGHRNDIEEFVDHMRSRPPSEEPWERQLLRWYTFGKRWMASNMPGNCLEINLALLGAEAAELALTRVEIVSLLEPSELGCLKQLEAASAEEAGACTAFVKYKDFQPLFQRYSPPCQ